MKKLKNILIFILSLIIIAGVVLGFRFLYNKNIKKHNTTEENKMDNTNKEEISESGKKVHDFYASGDILKDRKFVEKTSVTKEGILVKLGGSRYDFDKEKPFLQFTATNTTDKIIDVKIELDAKDQNGKILNVKSQVDPNGASERDLIKPAYELTDYALNSGQMAYYEIPLDQLRIDYKIYEEANMTQEELLKNAKYEVYSIKTAEPRRKGNLDNFKLDIKHFEKDSKIYPKEVEKIPGFVIKNIRDEQKVMFLRFEIVDNNNVRVACASHVIDLDGGSSETFDKMFKTDLNKYIIGYCKDLSKIRVFL